MRIHPLFGGQRPNKDGAGPAYSSTQPSSTLPWGATTDTNEGKKFIDEKTITTSVDGLRSFTFTPATSVSVGQTITATATRESTKDSTNDTSEFSAPKKVVAS